MVDVVPSELKLQRVLNTPLLTLYGLGVTVGAGIYVLIGTTASEAGIFAPISFVIAALVVAFTAFSYAEFSTRYPISAGEAAYVEAGFNVSWLATIVGIAVAASGIVSASAVSIGAALYLHDLTNVSPQFLVVCIVLVMGSIALLGVKQSVTAAAVITVIEIAGLLMVIIWGFFLAEPNGVSVVQMLPLLRGDHWAGIGAASLLAFFAFVGFEDMANVAEEVEDPVRTMPRAIILTLVIATLLYFATTCAALIAVPVVALADANAPLSLVFANAPDAVISSFGAIAIVATVNGVLIQMIMASRVIYGLSMRGHIPAVFHRVSIQTRTPTVATISVVGVILLLASTMPIHELAQNTSLIVLTVFILVNAALIRLKLRGLQAGGFFEVPILVPVLGVISSLALLAAAFL